MPEQIVNLQNAALRLVVDDVAGAVTVTVAGEIDIASASELASAMQTAASAAVGPIIVDASAVTFVDATGLRALVASDGRTPIRFRDPSPAVQRLLAIVGPGHLLEPAHSGPSIRNGQIPGEMTQPAGQAAL